MLGLSIVFAIILFCLMLIAERLTEGEALRRPKEELLNFDEKAIPRIKAYAALALSVGVIYFVLKKEYLVSREWRFLALLFAAVLIGWDVFLVYLWRERGSRFIELIPFAGVMCILLEVTCACAHLCATLVTSASWGKIITAMPGIIAVGMACYFVIDILHKAIEDYHLRAKIKEGGKKK